jgi:hypothetical protein
MTSDAGMSSRTSIQLSAFGKETTAYPALLNHHDGGRAKTIECGLDTRWTVRRKGQAGRVQVGGLDRHDAIPAIGMVLLQHIFDLAPVPQSGGDPNAAYFAALERLTAEEWRRSG